MFSRLATLTLVCAAFAVSSRAQTLLYSNFTGATGLTFNASEVVSGAVLLAQNQQDKSGSFFTTAQYNVAGFSAAFEFRISSPGGTTDGVAAGADGIAFVVQRAGANALGGNGEAIGYGARGGTLAIGTSIAVEFDTFKNSWDPNTNHIGINANGNLTSLATTGSELTAANLAFDNGGKWTAWVDYNGTTMEVRLSSDGIRPTQATLSYNLNLQTTIGGSSAYIGFTGATGSAYGRHEILGFAFSDTYLTNGVSVVPEPSTYALLALGLGFVGITIRRRSRKGN